VNEFQAGFIRTGAQQAMSITLSMRVVSACRLAATALMLSAAVQPALAEQNTVRIGGTGIALAAMREVATSLGRIEPGIRVDVLPSMGTPGGIKALAEGAIDIALVARPLKADEKAKGMAEAACMTTALIFASSHKAATGITRAQLPALYADASPKWPDGTPLNVILRSRSGSENSYLAAAIPAMGPALEAAFKRPGLPVASTDQDNARLAGQISGSLAMLTLVQSRAEQLDLVTLPFDGVTATAETIANKTYPFPIRICLAVANESTPAVARFIAHLRAPAGKALIESLGAILSE
jgi:phosphate transport system substrate-binding protein